MKGIVSPLAGSYVRLVRYKYKRWCSASRRCARTKRHSAIFLISSINSIPSLDHHQRHRPFLSSLGHHQSLREPLMGCCGMPLVYGISIPSLIRPSKSNLSHSDSTRTGRGSPHAVVHRLFTNKHGPSLCARQNPDISGNITHLEDIRARRAAPPLELDLGKLERTDPALAQRRVPLFRAVRTPDQTRAYLDVRRTDRGPVISAGVIVIRSAWDMAVWSRSSILLASYSLQIHDDKIPRGDGCQLSVTELRRRPSLSVVSDINEGWTPVYWGRIAADTNKIRARHGTGCCIPAPCHRA